MSESLYLAEQLRLAARQEESSMRVRHKFGDIMKEASTMLVWMQAESDKQKEIIEQLKEQNALLMKQAELEKLNLEDGNIHVMIKALNSRGKVVASYEKIHPMNVDHLHEACRRGMVCFKDYYNESNKPEKPVGPPLVSFISGKF